jgi:hypothetical protein
VTTAFAAAAAVRFTVQVEFPAAFNVFGEHPTELSTLAAGATRLTDAVRMTALRPAVMVAVWLEAIDPAVKLKEVLLAPPGTVTLPGAGSSALLLEIETGVALAAAFVSVTVHDVLCPPFRLPGEQLSEDSAAGANKLTFAVRVTPAALAVTVPVVSAATWAPVAVKLALASPEVTVTLPGTVREALLLERPTVKPPAGAEVVRVTVQPRVLGVWIEPEPQERLLRAATGARTVTVIVPPLPDAGIELTSDATTPVIPTVRVPDAFAAN